MVFFIPAAVGTGLSLAATLGRAAAPSFARGSFKRYFKYYGKQWGGRSAQGFPFGFGYASGTYTGFPKNYQESNRNAFKKGNVHTFTQKMPYSRYRRSYSRYQPRRSTYSRYRRYRPRYRRSYY